MKLLFAEDELAMSEAIVDVLTYHNYQVDAVYDGQEALDYARTETYDGIILDIMMPKVDGFTALREIRKFSQVPVIMLSARGEEYDKLFGFEMGVDDYITKPFSPKEIVARIKAILKRSGKTDEEGRKTIKIKGLEIDEDSRRVTVDGVPANLTPKEFAILVYMAKNKGVVLSREKILEKIWGYEFFGEDRTVDTHIKMLRNSIGPYRNLIKTVWSIGYKLEEDDENEKNQN